MKTCLSLKRRFLTTTTGKDPFKVLGVSPSASLPDIKLAYFSLAKEFHPDRNPHNAEFAKLKFHEATEAWERIQSRGNISNVETKDPDPDSRIDKLLSLLPAWITKEFLATPQYEVLLHPYLVSHERDEIWAEETLRNRLENEQLSRLLKTFPSDWEWKIRLLSKSISRFLRADPQSTKYTIEWARTILLPLIRNVDEKLQILLQHVPQRELHGLLLEKNKYLHPYLLGAVSLENMLERLEPMLEHRLQVNRLHALKSAYPGKERVVDFNLKLVKNYLTNPEKYPLSWALSKLDKYM